MSAPQIHPGVVSTYVHDSVGPVSSLHDRACELYYAIKGGTGESISKSFFDL